MTVEASIEAALLGAVRDLDIFDADRKAWPNITFVPPTGETYLRVDHVPNGNQRLFVKGSNPHLYLGILQLTVVSPLNAGPSAATQIAGRVAEEFPADLALYDDDLSVKVRIQKAPDVGSPIKVDASWNVPVSVRYECFSSPVLIAGLDFTLPANSQYVPLI